jgi:hypothetical protein
MILGLDRHPAAHCFDEIDDAISALQRENADDRLFVFNAHAFPEEIPADGIVFNCENVPGQVDAHSFLGHRVVDFSARNVVAWKHLADRAVKHVPVGYHPSMERFAMYPLEHRDIDVVLTGCVNSRRLSILQALERHGIRVAVVGPGVAYGRERDLGVLARSKLALNMLFYPDGTYPVLRGAHCVANRLPMVSEVAPEMPSWAGEAVAYGALSLEVVATLANYEEAEAAALRNYEAFRAQPMVLP